MHAAAIAVFRGGFRSLAGLLAKADFLPDLMRRRAAMPAARAKAPAGYSLA